MDSPRYRARRALLATIATLGLFAATATTAQAAPGQIRVIKGGDRVAGQTLTRSYAAPVAGAVFEYTGDAAKATDPASAGWTAFPATSAAGTATVSVEPGVYYVRERAAPSGFGAFGAVTRLAYDPSSSVPSAARPYVAKLRVSAGRTTEAYPNRLPGPNPGAWTSTTANDVGSPFVGVRDNAPFPEACGLNVLLVLDRSGSVAPHRSDFRAAAKSFVGALAGTPTQIGILSFSAGANAVNSYQDGTGSPALTHAPLDLGDAGAAAALDATIDRVYSRPNAGTDWDQALQKAAVARGFASNGATGQTTNPDVVVLLTDGNPTTRGTAGADSDPYVDLVDLTAGMASANLVKDQPSRPGRKLKLYALGVGGAVTPANLAAVSGPAVGDDYETPTVAELEAKLTELAGRTCGARVYVRKRVAGGAGDQPGWGFAATSTGGAVSYLDDNRRTHPTSGGAVETGVILTLLPEGGRRLTISEDASGQPLGEFDLDSAVCRTGGYDGTAVPATVDGLALTVDVRRGAALYCTFTNTPKPQIEDSSTVVVKDGDELAYPGDPVRFTFALTNDGDTTLSDVTVTDDRCAPVTGPSEKHGNADDLLDPGETWTFACSSQIPPEHGLGDENPIRDVVTATARDPLGDLVTSTDDHIVRVLHPAVAIDKTGPATATVGVPIGYALTVTNPGDVPFAAQDVAVTDPRCEAPPAGPSTGGDPTPGSLDPGDAWTYACTVQTAGLPAGPLVNSAAVTARDFNGRSVSDTDDFPTTLTESQVVLPGEIGSGRARLRGPSGCVRRAFKATVTGRRITQVTFFLDGKRLKRIRARTGQTTFKQPVDPREVGGGVHRVTARVVFAADSRTEARTLRLSFQRCARRDPPPPFTG